MRAGPAGHPGRRPDPRHHGPAQQAHRAAAMLIRASVQIVVDMIAPPGCRRSDPVRAGRVLGHIHRLPVFERYRRRRFPQFFDVSPSCG